MALADTDYVLAKLAWMREERIWPNGLRYLWTDAFGVVLYVSLYRRLGERRWLDEAEALVARLGEELPAYRERGVALVREVHDAFVLPGRGVIWKMAEDLSAPYPGYGLGAMDAFDGYVSYRLLDERALAREIGEMRTIMEAQYTGLEIDQDLGLGMMLWLAHFFPNEHWAQVHTRRSLAALDRLWRDPPGFFARASHAPQVRIAFANYGVSLGLQAADAHPERVGRLNAYFDAYRSGDEYDREAITHVMACTSHFPGAFLREGVSPGASR